MISNVSLKILEAILFLVGSEGIEISKISQILGISKNDTAQLIYKYSAYLEANDKPFELSIVNSRLKQITANKYFPYLVNIIKIEKNKPLTIASLEVLAIIAYNYDKSITRSDINNIRGVNSDSVIANLIIKELVEYAGHDETRIGHPLIIKTTNKFLEVFNLSKISELPGLDSFNESKIKSENMFKEFESTLEKGNNAKLDELLLKDKEVEKKISGEIEKIIDNFGNSEEDNNFEYEEKDYETNDSNAEENEK